MLRFLRDVEPSLRTCVLPDLQILLVTLELSSHGFALAFYTDAQETQVWKLVIISGT